MVVRRRSFSLVMLALVVAGGLLLDAGTAVAHPQDESATIGRYKACRGGFAGQYPCQGVDLLSHLPLAAIGGGDGNDLWGWTDSLTGREFVLMGRSTGTAFVEITRPDRPVYLGNLPARSGESLWRDIKVVGDHALIVSEAPNSGMQVFDLSRLLSVGAPPVTFTETAHYGGFSMAHNVVVNATVGHAYAVGGNTCNGGLHIIDVTTPTQPGFAGCYSADGYTHDAQCVTYEGPDRAHRGASICVAANEDTLTIVDVSNPANPTLIARRPYTGVTYSHQGWFTEDQRFFLLGDELDEAFTGVRTTTYVWDLRNLDSPSVAGTYVAGTKAIDHNQYVRGDVAYQANYRAGLRLVDVSRVASADLSELGYFDIYPADDAAGFNGAWSVYPFFDSGVVAVSGIEQGLFILYPRVARDMVRIADLDDRSIALAGTAWRARARVRVVDGDRNPVEGAAVKLRFANGKRRTCVTSTNGRCTVSIKLRSRLKIRATVKAVTAESFDYAGWANGDRDGSSDGTRIRLFRP